MNYLKKMEDVKPAKILFISNVHNIGGAIRSLVNMIEGFREEKNIDIDVKVLLPYRKKGSAKELLKNQNIYFSEIMYIHNYRPVNTRRILKYLFFDILNFIATRRIAHYIRKEKFDIVCSNSTAVDVGARAALLTNIPHIYYVREFMEEDFALEYRHKKQMKRLLESSEYVIFISKAIEKKFKSLYKLKNTVQFFNGFILQNYYIEGHDILKDEVISFVQVGVLTEAKGVIDTIEQLKELNRNGISNWRMEFVGNGTKECVEKMRKLITEYQLESQIMIGEFCSDIKKKLAKKDILIMNSRAEAFGRVTVEGMLAGCLVMGKYVGGTREIIIDGINGIAFETKKDFLDAIQRVMAEREKYRALAKKGQKYAVEKFDCINTAKNFMKVVNECL